MSELSTLIAELKVKASEAEQAIAQSLANHNFLAGHSAAIKSLLDMATSIAATVAPGNLVTEGLQVVDGIVDNASAGSIPTETTAS